MTTSSLSSATRPQPQRRESRHWSHRDSAAATAEALPVIPIYTSVLRQVHATISSRPAETGGLLLGPIGRSVITDFYFDESAACTGATYAPDHVTLNRLMKEVWMPSGIDMKGFIHSHPRGVSRLSTGDLIYIERLLKANDDMDVFVAPIVLPCSFRVHPFIVERQSPQSFRHARFDLIAA